MVQNGNDNFNLLAIETKLINCRPSNGHNSNTRVVYAYLHSCLRRPNLDFAKDNKDEPAVYPSAVYPNPSPANFRRRILR